MDISSATVEVRFPWFFERKSPKLEKAGLMHADIFMSVTYRKDQRLNSVPASQQK